MRLSCRHRVFHHCPESPAGHVNTNCDVIRKSGKQNAGIDTGKIRGAKRRQK